MLTRTDCFFAIRRTKYYVSRGETWLGKKSKTPRWFKNVNNLPADYKCNKKPWITGDIFSEGWKNGLNNWQKKSTHATDCRHLSGPSFCTKSQFHEAHFPLSEYDLCTSAYGSKHYKGIKSSISKTSGTQTIIEKNRENTLTFQ